MFDIFVYLFETYFYAQARPEPEQLARKLSAAGFEEEDISDALEWLSGLDTEGVELIAAGNDSWRYYSEDEEEKLDIACRGFLNFLEAAGALDAPTREFIIERAMALNEATVSLSRFKVIVLMVLWSRDQALNALIAEDLLSEEETDRFLH